MSLYLDTHILLHLSTWIPISCDNPLPGYPWTIFLYLDTPLLVHNVPGKHSPAARRTWIVDSPLLTPCLDTNLPLLLSLDTSLLLHPVHGYHFPAAHIILVLLPCTSCTWIPLSCYTQYQDPNSWYTPVSWYPHPPLYLDICMIWSIIFPVWWADLYFLCSFWESNLRLKPLLIDSPTFEADMKTFRVCYLMMCAKTVPIWLYEMLRKTQYIKRATFDKNRLCFMHIKAFLTLR